MSTQEQNTPRTHHSKILRDMLNKITPEQQAKTDAQMLVQREIKFRAWDGKEMHNEVQPYLWGDKPCVMAPMAGITFYEPTGTKRYWYEINVEAVMQWTGLTDKNGKDIYEGDILSDNRNYTWAVSWNQYHACFMVTSLQNGVVAEVIDTNMFIVGNIFESKHP